MNLCETLKKGGKWWGFNTYKTNTLYFDTEMSKHDWFNRSNVCTPKGSNLLLKKEIPYQPDQEKAAGGTIYQAGEITTGAAVIAALPQVQNLRDQQVHPLQGFGDATVLLGHPRPGLR